MSNSAKDIVLLTGATGFVGKSLYPQLIEQGFEVRCATRRPDSAKIKYPDRHWVEFDVERPETLLPAMQDCTTAFYLIHQMGSGEGYRKRERESTAEFLKAADEAGIKRVVYLGGVEPSGRPSQHLASRLDTGTILRSGMVSVIELRAAMIIGAESASWQIVRDLSARLPIMLLPRWTQSRLQPIYIDDVISALIGALTLEQEGSEWFDIPGPEIMSVEDILTRTAHILGHRTIRFRVPFLSPKFSSHWLRFITQCDIFLAKELVQGLKSDLVAHDDVFWDRIGHPERTSFDDAARTELRKAPPVSLFARFYEKLLTTFFRPKLLS